MVNRETTSVDSQTTADTMKFAADWQVPAFQMQEFAPRHHKYCVIIPVINEGERIVRLLRRMSSLKVDESADIIIVDGGSTDGSLNESLLRESSIRVLLTKTGPGKLSAQLRCAYAYALSQQYEGIVTIDGNDKDDPEAIPRLINALTEGVDFVQASRFIEGGGEENTPKLRRLAIRWIHAPVLSWSSGFHWTDTTQGYRAYSSRMLLDPKVAPFRDVFDTYELLAYLSHRVPKLGYVCQELPAIRRYPATGKTPTQISAFRGNFGVLGNLFTAVVGGYDKLEPKETNEPNPPSSRRWNHLGSLVCVLAVLAVFYFGLFNPRFSPDSWSYLELSDTVFADFYRVSTIRQFESTSPYSRSFPPLWPVSIAAFRQIFDLGIYSGYVLNAIICIAILPVMIGVGRRLSLPVWAGRMVFLALLIFPPFRGELLAARSVPLSMLLLGAIIYLLLKSDPLTIRRAAVVGLLAGLACLNRFDFLFAAFGLGIVLPWLSPTSRQIQNDQPKTDSNFISQGLPLSAMYYAVLLLALSPWFAYCLSHFGTPMASDNTRQVYQAAQTHVANFFSAHDSSPTLSTAPIQWMVGLLTTKLPAISRVGMMLMFAVPWLLVWKVRRGFGGFTDRRLWLIAIFVGAMTAIPAMLTGYGDSRYFIPHFLFITWMAASLVRGDEEFPAWVTRYRFVFQVASLGMLLVLMKVSVEQLQSLPTFNVQTAATQQYQSVVELLEREPTQVRPARVLVAGEEACQFGAISKVSAVLAPFNLDPKNLPEFVSRFGITHLLDPKAMLLEMFHGDVTVESTDLAGLYRVVVRTAPQPPVERIGQTSGRDF